MCREGEKERNRGKKEERERKRRDGGKETKEEARERERKKGRRDRGKERKGATILYTNRVTKQVDIQATILYKTELQNELTFRLTSSHYIKNTCIYIHVA